MCRNILIALILIASGCFILSCESDDSPTNSQPPPEPTPIDSATYHEARLMSLWYGDDIEADSAFTERFYVNLYNLREKYADSIPQVNIHFVFPAVISQILVGLTDSAAEQYVAGNYHALDLLNLIFEATSVDSGFHFDFFKSLKIVFNGIKNPLRLAEYYRNCDGVRYAERNGYMGDWACTYPWMVNDRVTFLVREAWGDCPAGCIYSHYFYFKETDTGMAFIGDWQACQPQPDWWDEVLPALRKYRGY
jgi:hypothetical protein